MTSEYNTTKMDRINVKLIVMALSLTAIMIQGTSGKDQIVGSNSGWTNTANIDYTQQFASARIQVGDVLKFNFRNGAHDVAEVTKAAYDACTPTPPIIIRTDPPVTISLNNTGFRYFICTIGTHCANGGQKLAVNVVAEDSPPALGGNSAAAHGVGFSLVLVSVSLAVALFSG